MVKFRAVVIESAKFVISSNFAIVFAVFGASQGHLLIAHRFSNLISETDKNVIGFQDVAT
jgi:hypothetical protein